MAHYDVIIIGAGPAGSTAARLLADNNLNVLLLEKYKIPRVKICAGGLPGHIDSMLPFSVDSVVSKLADNTLFTFKQKKPIKLISEKVKIKMVMRKDFDTFLIEKAIENKITFKDNFKVDKIVETKKKVKVCSGAEFHTADFVIGADGANSVVLKSTGLLKKRKRVWAINAEVYVSDKQLEQQGGTVNVEMGLVPKGYIWIFPKKDHLSCGLGSDLKKIGHLKQVLFDYLDTNPTTKNYSKIELKGHPIPYSFSNNLKINTDRTMLIGDAAYVVDPLSGEGIFYAIKSAEIAVKHLLYRYQTDSISFDSYSQEINKTIREDLKFSNQLTSIFHKFPKLTYDLGVSNSHVNQKFQELIVGNTSYKKMYHELKAEYSGKFRKKAANFLTKIKNKILKNE